MTSGLTIPSLLVLSYPFTAGLRSSPTQLRPFWIVNECAKWSLSRRRLSLSVGEDGLHKSGGGVLRKRLGRVIRKRITLHIPLSP